MLVYTKKNIEAAATARSSAPAFTISNMVLFKVSRINSKCIGTLRITSYQSRSRIYHIYC